MCGIYISNSPGTRLQCLHCYHYSSADVQDLMYHCRACTAMPRADPVRDKFVCVSCHYATYISTNMRNHLRTHTGSRPYNCARCKFSGASSQALKYHERSAHTLGIRTIRSDPAVLTDGRQRMTHAANSSVNGGVYYNCDQCGDFDTPYETLLTEHIKYYHNGFHLSDVPKDCDFKPSLREKTLNIKMEMDYGVDYFSQGEETLAGTQVKQEWLDSHLKFEFEEELNGGLIVHKDVFECELCDEVFVSKDNYSSHLAGKVHAFNEISTKHVTCANVSTGQSDDDSDGNNRLPSRKTLFSYVVNENVKEEQEYDYLLEDDESNLLQSIRETNNLQCKQCEFRATNVKGIRTHIYKKHVQHHISFSCQVCAFQSPFRSCMNDHYRTEHKEVEFTCELCHQAFKSFLRFDIHLRDHSFTEQCEVCFEEVIGKYKIFSHYQQHHKGYVFQCKQCAYTSTSNKLFIAHLSKMNHTHLKQISGPNDSHSSSHLIEENGERSEMSPDVKSERDEKAHVTKVSVLGLNALGKRENDQTETNIDDNYKCNICNCYFNSHFDLELHMKDLHRYPCSKCDHVACSIESLNSHTCPEESHENDSDVISEQLCPFCSRNFHPSVDLTKHINLHHGGNTPYLCNICKQRFSNSASLKAHLDCEHSLDHPFACSECPRRFKEHRGILRHTYSCHTSSANNTLGLLKPSKRTKKMSCNHCRFQTRKKNHFQRHMLLHSLDRKYQCFKCKKRFSKFGQCRAHERNVHFSELEREADNIDHMNEYLDEPTVHEEAENDNTREENISSQSVNYFVCDKCKRAFVSKKGYANHMRYHNAKFPCVCKLCGYRFKTLEYLTRHEINHESKTASVCKECHCTVEPKEYKFHVESHQRYRDSSGLPEMTGSDLRTNVFESQPDTRSHVAQTPQADLSCDTCKRTFYSLNSWSIHMRNHDLKKLHVCKECKFRFSSESDLKTHQRYHNPESTFKCENCYLKFSDRKSYLIHMRSHEIYGCNEVSSKPVEGAGSTCENNVDVNKEDDLLCHKCKLAFDSANSCKIHKFQHNSQRKIVCERCNFRFKDESRLALHEQMHNRRNRHVCVICFFRFARRDVYDQHIARHEKYKKSAPISRDFKRGENLSEFCHANNIVEQNYANDTTGENHADIVKQNEHPCHICKRNFNSIKAITRHKNYHNPRRLFVCKICHFRFKIKYHLVQHQTFHTPQYTFVCVRCNLRFSKRENHTLHMFSHERYQQSSTLGFRQDTQEVEVSSLKVANSNEMSSFNGDSQAEMKLLSCNKCKRTFDTHQSAKHHKNFHDTRRQIVCKICDFRFHDELKLENHQQLHNSERPFGCKKCELYFKENKSYIPHMLSHKKYNQLYDSRKVENVDVISENSKEKDNKTNESKNSRDNKEIVKHTESETGQKQLACNRCKRIFDNICGYNRHMHLHDMKKPIICKICNFRFKHKSILERHQYYHDPGLPYRCKKCKFGYSQAANYSKHMKSHARFEQNDQSEENQLSDNPNNLKKASSSHDLENIGNIYTCDLCNFKSKIEATFLQHMGTHEKWFKCSVCPSSYGDLRTLRDHVLRAHDQVELSAFECVCGHEYSTCKQLSHHISRAHRVEKVKSKTEQSSSLIPISPLKESDSSTSEETNDFAFKCVVCETIFDRISPLKNHMENFHNRSSYKCWACGFICNKAVNLTAHLVTHPNYLKCLRCSQEYKSYHSKLRHMQEYVTLGRDQDFTAESISTPFFEGCPSGTFLTSSFEESNDNEDSFDTLLQPNVIVHNNVLECKACDEIFVSKEMYKIHFNSAKHKMNKTKHRRTKFTALREKILAHKKSAEVENGKEHSNFGENPLPRNSKGPGSSGRLVTRFKLNMKGKKIVNVGLKKTPSNRELSHLPVERNANDTNMKYSVSKDMDVIVLLENCDLDSLKIAKGYGSKTFMCNICEFKAINQSELDRHLEDDHENKNLKCTLCDYFSTSLDDKQRHMTGHAGVTYPSEEAYDNFQCSFCDYVCESGQDRDLHILNHFNLKCNECSYIARSIDDRQEHDKMHLASKYKCKSCDYLAADDRDKFLHEYKHEMEKLKCLRCEFIPNTFEENDVHVAMHERENLKCDMCEYQAITRRDYRRHREKHDRQNIKCNLCSFQTVDQAELNNHIDEIHADEKIKCETCAEVFRSKGDLKKHRLTAHTKRFKCELCEFDSVDRWYTEKHMESHEGYIFRCKLCDFECKYSKRYRMHVRSKHNMKEWKCKMCDINFKYRSGYKIHMETKHYNQRSAGVPKRFACNQCQYTCSKISYLKAHMIVHTNEKPFKCHLCEYSTKKREYLKQHLVSHTTGRPYKCDKCEETFKTMSTLVNHLAEVHNEDKPFQCDLCDSSFKSSGNLKSHMTTIHSDLRPYKCELCEASFKTTGNLKTHMSVHTEARPYQCEQCEYSCKNTSALRNHMLVHTEERPYKCDSCESSFKTLTYLKNHQNTAHSEERPFKCELCDYTCKQAGNLKVHMSVHTEERPYQCEVCEVTFKSTSGLKTHMLVHTEERPFNCDQCDFSFKTMSYLKNHMIVHMEERPYQCDLCESSFKTLPYLKNHQNSAHSEERPYKCDLCEYTSKQPGTLRTHMMVHTEDRPYKCELCDYATKSNQSLKHHMLVHTEERPYKCELCDFSFKTITYLKNHQNTAHSEDRPYKCDLCDSAFKQAGNLKSHMTVHTDERPYKCELCDYSCKNTAALKSHMVVHTEERPFACDICDVSFKTTAALHTHTAIVHSDERPHGCDVCGLAFKTAGNLKAHMTVHTEERPFKCELCDYTCKQAAYLKTHMSTVHTEERPYQCEFCEFTGKSSSVLRSHMFVHTEERPFECEFCDMAFKNATGLRHHLVTHNEERPFTCEICDLSFKLKPHLQSHASVVHSEDRPFACELCASAFKTNGNLKAHMLVHSEEKPYECELCDYTCKSAGYLKSHMIVHSEERPYHCDFCDYSSKTMSQLGNHMIVHSEERPFECEYCEFKTKTNHNLKIHMAVHTDERPYECEICDFKFKTAPSLRTHQVVHTEERPFSCDICNVSFKTAAYLQKHSTVVHSDDRPFKCEICASTFKTSSNLKTHLSVHSEERPYECEYCDYSGKTSGNLKTHLAVHSDERPYECDSCELSFKTASTLRTHIVTHFEERPFPCEVCDVSFKLNSYLQKHTSLVHTQHGRPFAPDICDSSFKTALNVKSHKAIHIEKKTFNCKKCKIQFNKKEDLKIHMTSHQLDLPFECELCEYRCARKAGLRSHMATHSENCSFVCEHCEFCANTEDDLEEHVVNAHYRPTHAVKERKKPAAPKSSVLQQQISSRHSSFMSNNFLSRFVISNKSALKSDANPKKKTKDNSLAYAAFSCKDCSASFKYKPGLQRHIYEKHGGEPQYPCDLCDKKYFRKEQYNQHMLKHNIEINNASQS